MPGLAILNPRRATSKRRRRRNAGRTRGGTKRRRKMTAKQLRYFGPRKSKKKTAGAKGKVIIVESNPKGRAMAKRRRRKHRKTRKAKFFSNPRRRFRRNPRTPGASFLNNTLVPAAIGAAGAVGVDLLLGNMPMPWQFRRGPMLPLVRIGLALLVGAAVGAVSNREAGEEAAAGGVIVTLYGLGRNFFLARMPGFGMARYVPLNGMGNMVRQVRRPGNMKRYVPLNGMGRGLGLRGQPPMQPPGMLLRPAGGGNMGLGYVNPARTSRMNRGLMRYMGN